jgi:hypothetical protein
MPDREIILRRLKDSGVLGVSEPSNAFFYKFTEYLADRPVIGPVLNLFWAQAMTDTMSGYPPQVSLAMNLYFNRAIEAVTQDPEVTEEAKVFREQIYAELKKRVELAQPNPEDLGPKDSLHDLERYTQARKIADLVFQYTSEDSQVDDRREEEANPYYNQTHRGFFLEQYYGLPNKIWTPWGEYGFGGSGSGWDKKTLDKILQRLGATLHKPLKREEYGEVGPIYALHKIDDIELPDPVERPRKAYIPYKESKDAWRKLTKEYYESQEIIPPLTVTEQFALDNAILEERGKNEPPVNDSDIKELALLSFYIGKVVKYTKDDGKTWHYTKLDREGSQYFQGGNLGFGAYQEVLPNTQVHSSVALTAKDFDNGMVVRPVTEEEIKGIKFSYEFEDIKDKD